MKKLLKIAFNLPLYSTYDYLVPEYTAHIRIGMRVEAPFGRKKLIGIISEINTIDIAIYNKYKLKTIYSVLDTKAIITKDLMKICKWASNYYQHPLGQVYFSCIPSKLKKNNVVNVKNEDFQNHSFFKKLNGHPFAIILATSIGEKLTDIYDLVMKHIQIDTN